MSVKKQLVPDLLAEADELRRIMHNKAVMLRRVANDPKAVKRIADEIKEICR